MNNLIPNYPEGSDITLLNATYRYPKKEEDGSYSDDFIEIVYKDNMTGEKKHETIYKPDYEFYIANDNILIDHNLFFIEEENVTRISTPFTNLEKTIAELTNNLPYFYENINNGNRRANKDLHELAQIFNSDMNIEDHYRFRFDKLYKNEPFNLNKAYFDIEVDGINMKGDFPEMGECPINALSYIDDKANMIYIFLLRNEENPLIEKFEKSINSNLFNKLRKFIIDKVGGIKAAKKFKVADLNYEFRFYDDEILLIKDFFDQVNKNQPDFLLAWNMAFDVPYIIERLIELGYDPADIISHSDFIEKMATYFIDTQHQNIYEARGDEYKISSYTVFIDQLIHFASRRKGQAAFPNFKLDTAGEIIAKVKKLDYSHITTNVAKLPYLDYETFVFYNIMDTIVQKCIEEKVGDIDYIFGKCNVNNTRYSKGHRQTVYLANRGIKEFIKDGFIMGNNINRHTIKTPFPGALVGDPLNNSDYSKIKQNGEVLNIANNLDDFDYKSLYPSIARENNMAPNTQIGKIIIEDKVHQLEDPFKFEHYDRGGQFIEDLTSGNILEFSHRWFNFANYKEWLDDLIEYFTTIQLPIRPLHTSNNGLINPIEYYPNIENNLINPIYYNSELESPIIIDHDKIDTKEYLNKINNY